VNVIIAGATGFIGTALVPALREQGHRVVRLVRTADGSPDAIGWDPGRGALPSETLETADAVINLAGENVAAGRWTAARRERILRSRIDSTRTLVDALRAATPRPRVWLNASAIGYYGDRGAEILTEASSRGTGFLADVCVAWEAEAMAAARFNVRAVTLRFGVVLDGAGGALAKLRPFFQAGLGGRLGSGEQWMSWITREDAVGVIGHALSDPRCIGPLNVVAPHPVTNAVFTAALGRVMHRPTFFPTPKAVLRTLFGQMAEETVLASARAMPERLQEWGYRFRHPMLENALPALLAPRR
jgi:uncharacterized protein